MTIPDLDPTTGTLPTGGRFPCQVAEVKSGFVDVAWAQGSTTRSEIWSHFEEATTRLHEVDADLIDRLWIGGSFVSNKLDPDDIDVTYLLDGAAYAGLSNAKKKRVTNFGKKGHLRAHANLRVDAFVLATYLVPVPFRDPLDDSQRDYFLHRGMWDDWWLRTRTSPKGDEPLPDEARPARGYLEVVL